MRNDGVWLVNVDGGSPAQIVGELTGRYSPWGYYGQVTWAAAVAWHR